MVAYIIAGIVAIVFAGEIGLLYIRQKKIAKAVTDISGRMDGIYGNLASLAAEIVAFKKEGEDGAKKKAAKKKPAPRGNK